jgi:hypothetical protein
MTTARIILVCLILVGIPLMICSSAAGQITDSTDGAGWYQISGFAWSGVDLKTDGQFGFCTGLGRWYSLGRHPHFFLTTPLTLQIGIGSEDDETGLIGFNPQVAMQIGRVILTMGSGVTKYYADNGVSTYGQIDGSITVIVSDKKLFGAELTVAGRYLPGNKHKTIIVGMTILD